MLEDGLDITCGDPNLSAQERAILLFSTKSSERDYPHRQGISTISSNNIISRIYHSILYLAQAIQK